MGMRPFFLDSPRGPLFCLYRAPVGVPPCGAVLYLHPFAEEMHKSRRMVAQQARYLAAAGWAVLQIDLTGCGDSAGDFGDATWEAWLGDAALGLAWLKTESGHVPRLWGLRTGALLALDLAAAQARLAVDVGRVVLWQSVVDGELFLNQFLRLRLAREMLAGGQAQSGLKALRAALASGASLEIAGFMLSAPLAQALADHKLARIVPPGAVSWLELKAPGTEPVFAPASQAVMACWQQAQAVVSGTALCGDPFWSTQEISECPELLALTLAALEA